jgi:hypothetical protein
LLTAAKTDEQLSALGELMFQVNLCLSVKKNIIFLFSQGSKRLSLSILSERENRNKKCSVAVLHSLFADILGRLSDGSATTATTLAGSALTAQTG